ncbi:MAG: hypothetical protein LBT05_01615 [Planctomycetaceae bacterium]|jgi:cell division septation protein DedD|nr:hypothetical protein [Planctomycetaceae bacterium]
MRALRRQLRIWKNDFLSVYLRLTTFHRTVVGLLLALAMIMAARHYWLNPLLTEIKTAKDKYEASNPPDILTTPENDAEIQDVLTKIEGRSAMLEERKKEEERIAKSKQKITQQNKTAVISQFGTLILQEDLQLINTRPATVPPVKTETPKPETKTNTKKKTESAASKTKTEQTPTTVKQNVNADIPSEAYDYLIEGDYQNMLKFLQAADKFEYPVKMNSFRLGFPEIDPGIAKLGAAPVNRRLQLKFQLTLYFY